MAEYIVVDKAGNELRREPKGRGRNRIGAVQLPDGNWKVTEKEVETPAPSAPVSTEPAVVAETTPATEVNATEPAKEEATSSESDEPGPLGVIKIINNPNPVSADKLVSSIFCSNADKTEKDNKIDLRRVVISAETNVNGIDFNSTYSRVLINKTNGEVIVWSDYPGNPKCKVKNAVMI